MAFRDSLGNSYDHIPSGKKKGAKGAKPGPKHGRKSRYTGDKKKHGVETRRNGASSRKRFFGEPGPREAALSAMFALRDLAALAKLGTNGPRETLKSPSENEAA